MFYYMNGYIEGNTSNQKKVKAAPPANAVKPKVAAAVKPKVAANTGVQQNLAAGGQQNLAATTGVQQNLAASTTTGVQKILAAPTTTGVATNASPVLSGDISSKAISNFCRDENIVGSQREACGLLNQCHSIYYENNCDILKCIANTAKVMPDSIMRANGTQDSFGQFFINPNGLEDSGGTTDPAGCINNLGHIYGSWSSSFTDNNEVVKIINGDKIVM